MTVLFVPSNMFLLNMDIQKILSCWSQLMGYSSGSGLFSSTYTNVKGFDKSDNSIRCPASRGVGFGFKLIA